MLTRKEIIRLENRPFIINDFRNIRVIQPLTYKEKIHAYSYAYFMVQTTETDIASSGICNYLNLWYYITFEKKLGLERIKTIFPELYKYEPKTPHSRAYWFGRTDNMKNQEKRARILLEILNKLETNLELPNT